MNETVATPKGRHRTKRSTREHLLDTAGLLLAEVGMERISTNMICERAGVTPPALYYYFQDKFEIVEALGQRLMDRQNEALVRWLEKYAADGAEGYANHTEELLRELAEITKREPGGIWIERALHSSPKLEHVRIESHRYVTNLLTEAFAAHLPDVSRDLIWRRMRMLIEFGYMAMELLHAETELDRNVIISDTAAMQTLVTRDLFT